MNTLSSRDFAAVSMTGAIAVKFSRVQQSSYLFFADEINRDPERRSATHRSFHFAYVESDTHHRMRKGR